MRAAARGARPVGIASVALLGVLSLAPTPGDVGGCGRTPELLDERAFASARKTTDCQRCTECAIRGARCERACQADVAPETAFPPGCEPLVRDGEVCIRALRVASCGSYGVYLSDTAPAVPNECEFCRAVPQAPSGPLLPSEAGP